MKNKSARIPIVILAILLLLPTLISCSSSESEVIGSAKELIPRAMALEDIIWGEGLPADGSVTLSGEESGPVYCPVSSDAPFTDVSGLLLEMAGVYTLDYAEELMALLFSGDSQNPPRYSTDENGALLIDLTYPAKKLGKNVDLEKMTVTLSNPYAVTLSLPFSRANGENGELSVTLSRVGDEWFLTSPTSYLD